MSGRQRLSRAKGHRTAAAKPIPGRPGYYYYPGESPAYVYQKGRVTYKTANDRIAETWLLVPVAPLLDTRRGPR
jgi:hypothetical protein